MDLFQGMDHALRSDSSKRPGKNRDVEALMGKSEVFGGRDPITDFLPQRGRRQSSRPGDEGCAWIGRYDGSSRPDDSPRQPSVAAADLQDPCIFKRNLTPQHSHFGSIGVPTAPVHLVPPFIVFGRA